jgi:2-polyprenyl-3-methyl-5-hydroxy-6-metoxy-1,4-benzoquinol methylase
MIEEATEKEKYLTVWNHREYRTQCDGEPVVEHAHVSMGCVMGESVIDWGCGTGRCAAAFQRFGLLAIGFDIADNCLDANVNVPLVVGTMWNPPAELPESDYAFCADVLEHLPEVYVGAALDAIADRTRKAAYIQVDTVLDTSGPKMKPPMRLHLTVRPHDWWLDELKKRWASVLVQPASYTRSGFLCRHA